MDSMCGTLRASFYHQCVMLAIRFKSSPERRRFEQRTTWDDDYLVPVRVLFDLAKQQEAANLDTAARQRFDNRVLEGRQLLGTLLQDILDDIGVARGKKVEFWKCEAINHAFQRKPEVIADLFFHYIVPSLGFQSLGLQHQRIILARLEADFCYMILADLSDGFGFKPRSSGVYELLRLVVCDSIDMFGNEDLNSDDYFSFTSTVETSVVPKVTAVPPPSNICSQQMAKTSREVTKPMSLTPSPTSSRLNPGVTRQPTMSHRLPVTPNMALVASHQSVIPNSEVHGLKRKAPPLSTLVLKTSHGRNSNTAITSLQQNLGTSGGRPHKRQKISDKENGSLRAGERVQDKQYHQPSPEDAKRMLERAKRFGPST